MRKIIKLKAFTLIELMVAITIIGILSSFAIIALSSVRQKSQDTGHLSGIRELQISLEAYKSVNGKYPDAGTLGSSNYIINLAPNFINKLPVDAVQSATAGYQYTVSTDKKTYCIYVRGTIFKPETQESLYSTSCPKTWVACKGPAVSSHTTCSGIISS